MAGQLTVLVTLDGQVHDPSRPLLFADDLAAVRGDGVFETLLVRAGEVCLLDAHLRRLARSAAMVELPEPDDGMWRRAVAVALAQWRSHGSAEGALRLVYSRGRECGSPPTAYLTISPLAGRVMRARREGVSAVVLQRGLPDHAAELPWLLAGAKTLSYAVNMAALRYAEHHGADDVIFVSAEGRVLEGPRSTVVVVTETDGCRWLLTPPLDYPILAGTTQHALFDVAGARGYRCDYREMTPADLVTAQGVWLVSSITLAARVHTLDGEPLSGAATGDDIPELVDAAILSDR